MNNDLISREALIEWIDDSVSKYGHIYSTDTLDMWGLFKDYLINFAPTVEPQKVVTIPHELIEKLVLCVVDTVENIDWDKAIEAYKARPQGEWIRMALDNKTIVYCSECHLHYEYPFNYCPNCGAEMKGGAE